MSTHRRPRSGHALTLLLPLLALGGWCCGDGGQQASGDRGTAAGPGPGPAAETSPTPTASTATTADAEVAAATDAFRRMLLSQPVGFARVGDLGLSEPLLVRAADRRLRADHFARFHAVFADREPTPGEIDEEPAAPAWPVSVTIEPHIVPDAVMSLREEARTAVPARRGFRVPRTVAGPPPADVADPAAAAGSMDVTASAEWSGAADLVARRLAADGLAATTVRAIASIRAAVAAGSPLEADAVAEGLAGVGLPVDLLAFVSPPGSPGTPAPAPAAPAADTDADTDAARRDQSRAWIAAALARLEAGDDPDTLTAAAAERPVAIRPSIPGFRAAADDGGEPLALIRLQPTRGRYWAGRGGGGSLDLAVSLLESLPEVAFILSIGSPFVPDALARMAPARERARGRVTVVDEPHVVSQWAQDNGQPGFVTGDDRPWLLAPRYASRGDFGSVFVPGDTWLVEGLPAAGIPVARSPLLFQGGNLLVASDPRDPARRLLLLGDAEVNRNIALGLPREAIIEGFRREFAVDRVEVLSPPAFHLDFATTVRRLPATDDTPARSVAFVHDEDRGHAMVLEAGIERLAAAGILDRGTADAARAMLAAAAAGDAAQAEALVQTLGPVVYARQRPDGQWPLSFADIFGAAEGGEGIAVLDRFLCSFERLMGLSVDLARVPGPPAIRASLATWRRRQADLAAFNARLESLGFEPVSVPGFSLESRSVNTVNMVHGRDLLLRPITGGVLAPHRRDRGRGDPGRGGARRADGGRSDRRHPAALGGCRVCGGRLASPARPARRPGGAEPPRGLTTPARPPRRLTAPVRSPRRGESRNRRRMATNSSFPANRGFSRPRPQLW